jgi:hypothetical protein
MTYANDMAKLRKDFEKWAANWFGLSPTELRLDRDSEGGYGDRQTDAAWAAYQAAHHAFRDLGSKPRSDVQHDGGKDG